MVAGFAIDAGRHARPDTLGRVIVDLQPAEKPTSASVEFEACLGAPAAVFSVALGDLIVLWNVKTKSNKSSRRKN